ncbi:hypothetical protein DV515_00012565 [Chloebia gouldiae]|uniref:Uncharacterized protein n=1 Tax=Chloebia gouldiae TaxID=44316 RepID=A0A3L8S3E6_CHLGU|nr:hypothetical protein DV515_00012565 [Chloebia gouldiae]
MLLFPFSSTASGEGADTAKKCFSHEMALVLARVLLGEDWQPQQHLKQGGPHLSDMPTPTTDKITQAAMETIYLCKFRVSMDGEWLCLRELDDISLTPDPEPTHEAVSGLCISGRKKTVMCAQREHLITICP